MHACTLVVVAYLCQYLEPNSQTWPIMCVLAIAIKSNSSGEGDLAL